mmetsp:Transcript_72704/g.189143  ORF Transcript_72704/g.189143 Transcript_72704/m.189143 type:complete len:291 (+) Transcript_72704:90-962(+)
MAAFARSRHGAGRRWALPMLLLPSLLFLLGAARWQAHSRAFALPGSRVARAAAAAQVSGDWGRSATADELTQALPVLHVYDHCPFCVRVRMIFGLKGLPYRLSFLMNDDVVTPTKLIGKKVLPVLEQGSEAMGESLDIVKKVDEADGPVLKPSVDRQDIAAWQNANAMVIRKLTRPRVADAFLPEFATKAARATWIRNHQFSDGTEFRACMEASPELIKELTAELPKLDAMLDSETSVNLGGVSYDDITLFPALRTLTLVKGLQWPEKLGRYIAHMAEVCDIDLYDKQAC